MTLPPSVHNRTSYAGAAIAVLAFMAIVFLFIINTFVNPGQAPYAGLVIFVVLPAVLLFGLALIPLGMYVEWRHILRTGKRTIETWPVVDLNRAGHRNAAIIFAIGSTILLFLSIFGSYQAYESTESVAFCGTTCHTVMHPEYTTYQNGPHARVRCVDCHVGPGADWYVKSKLSGLYQVYAVALDKYPRPIPAPISSLRPAQQTCEQCHWPEKFFGGMEKRVVHRLSDPQNSPWEIRLLLKVGGGRPIAGRGSGIHWHMNIGSTVEYVATDPQRQQIPWVRITDRQTGQTTVFTSGDPPTQEQMADIRSMDCMDCHNRPSHVYRAPGVAIDRAIEGGFIDPTLPSIKETGVQLLTGAYTSTDEALMAIAKGIVEKYQQSDPAVLERQRDAVDRAVDALQTVYRNNFFPTMQARWDAYPENIGHLIFSGCFRCHDNNHQTADGKVLSNACDSCHDIVAQGPPDALEFSPRPGGLPFKHPVEIGDAWQSMPCNGCHTTG